MKNNSAAKFGFLFLLSICAGGCSLVDSAKNSASGGASNSANTAANAAPSGDKKGETASASPCNNLYHPVADGKIKNYKMSVGKNDARYVQKYTPGEANFVEEFTVGGTTVKHSWNCTADGLVAANPGSMMNSQNMQLEPKHISGVTLPNDGEIKVGKTWSTVYQATGKSAVGDIDSTVTVNNKVVALDDEVKVPAGTFKAVKIETVFNVDMKLNGNKIPSPPVKSAVWYAPNVGMVKNANTDASFGNSTMEYAGDK